MKRIKKTLCLMLVLALALGMVPAMTATTAVALDFEDADDIKNVEAASVLNALGIIVGDSVGFRPDDTINRAEAATIITRMLIGADMAKIYEESTASSHFTDVSSNQWWSGVIMFTYERGIMYGTNASGTRFSPRDTLTIPQFAIMLMRALGKATTNDYRDGNWIADALTDAMKLKLLDGVSAEKLTDPATRDIAAQMALNGLTYADDATTVPVTKYIVVRKGADKGLDSRLSTAITNNPHDSFQDALNAATSIVAGGNTAHAAVYDDNFTIVAVPATDEVRAGSLARDVHNLSSSTATDAFGRPDAERTWKVGSRTIHSSVVRTAGATFTTAVTQGQLYTALGLSSNVANATVIEDGIVTKDADQAIVRGANASGDTIPGSGRGVLTQAYRDGNRITIVVVNTFLGTIGAPTAATPSADRFVPVTRYEGVAAVADPFNYDTEKFARNDVVLMTFARNADNTDYDEDTLYSIDVVTPLSDVTIDRFVANTSVTFGGSTRQYSAKAVYGAGNFVARSGFSFTSAYNVYLDNYGNLIGIRAVSAAPITSLEFAYVLTANATAASSGDPWGSGGTAPRLQVEAFFLNGSRRVLDLEVRTASAADVSASSSGSVIGETTLANGDPFARIGNTFYNLKSTSTVANINNDIAKKVFSYTMNEDYIVLSSTVATTAGDPVTRAAVISSTITLAANDPNVGGITGVSANANTRIVYVGISGDPPPAATYATAVSRTGVGAFPDASGLGVGGQIVSVSRGSNITDILILGGTGFAGAPPAVTTLAVYTGYTYEDEDGVKYELLVDGELGEYTLTNSSATPSARATIFEFAEGANSTIAHLTAPTASTNIGNISDVTANSRRVTAAATVGEDDRIFYENGATFSTPLLANNVIIYDVSASSSFADNWKEVTTIPANSWIVWTTASNRVSQVFIVPAPAASAITAPTTPVTASGDQVGASPAIYSVTASAISARVGAVVTITVTVTTAGSGAGGTGNNTISLAGVPGAPLTVTIPWNAAVDTERTITFTMGTAAVTPVVTVTNNS